MSRSIAALIAHDLAEVHRIPGPRRGVRVRILLGNLRVTSQCEAEGCPRIAEKTGKWCARCRQLFGRDDRAWQVRALELHAKGLTPTRIAIVLDRPLWAASEPDARASGGAVVPYLLEQGVLDAAWAERLRVATRGHVDE